MQENAYIAIDLKSFYASVECMERGLDPLTTNLVVADATRTEKTICLAVSPSMKAHGIPGRARLFEVIQKMKEVNARRQQAAPGRSFTGASVSDPELKANPSLSADYITAPPRMAFYMSYSTRIYNIYLKYIAPEDIHVYSIDEVLIDATRYLSLYHMTARALARKMILDVLETTGITATAGVGTNLYLCKIAMDVMAKHIAPDKNGVRIAELNELSYRQNLWDHRPLTDFWRIGRGIAKKLEANGLYTMGDIARCSLGAAPQRHCEELLYKLFGINAELLIDHAWGWEPCTMADIKAYRPSSSSLSSGQVLPCPYPAAKAKLIVMEMTDAMALKLVEKKLVTDQLILDIGYDIENSDAYQGKLETDRYGRCVPKAAHGSAKLERQTASAKLLLDAAMGLYDRIVDKQLSVRRIYVTVAELVGEEAAREPNAGQLDLFTSAAQRDAENDRLAREKKMQQTVLELKRKYGKNAVLKGMNLREGATAVSRNAQIGGHKA